MLFEKTIDLKKKTKGIMKIYERVGNISRTIIKRKHEKVQ